MSKKLFPDENILTTKYFDVSQDWEIPIPGFFIIAPLRKVRSVAEFSDEEATEFIYLVRKVRKGMKDVLGIEDVYFFQNEDTEHNYHQWILPRHKWMEKFGKKIESVRPIMNYAKENMVNDSVFKEVRGAVQKMKTYMSA
ncbi:MAG: diadenosine tetraphosphate hydrolase [Candidatus Taylorbacteria bacterium CG11_big_fil_rev_8_21_14_0_20_46_11]|uniref:Diadenosine tetraphosphate hydrolase n=1 Tax=Candidatus Taylorbacteria bacterium CG11_big_fil_rev_8_21_14_0_20_46_11 TaxID=1975025 RepID=A0A2H0KCX1_9BACT|nr:MAG: diadenosine tetraphosphate hydrolase [Candidatus Taylorbacteria bacterium CG11_big_fil_rev_8_21_14_0_20_46_11]